MTLEENSSENNNRRIDAWQTKSDHYSSSWAELRWAKNKPQPLAAMFNDDYDNLNNLGWGLPKEFTYLITNSADPDQWLIWVYTLCKGRVYPGSAGQGLRKSPNFSTSLIVILHAYTTGLEWLVLDMEPYLETPGFGIQNLTQILRVSVNRTILRDTAYF